MLLYILFFLPILTFCDIRKIDPNVINLLDENQLTRINGKVDVVIYLKNGDPIPRLNHLVSRITRTQVDPGLAVYSELKDFADKSQRNVLSRIDQMISTKPRINRPRVKNFWISNFILVKDSERDILSSISEDPNVESIVLAPKVYFIQDEKVVDPDHRCRTESGANETWGLERVRATEVWAHPNGTMGERALVGIIDSGMRGSHEALRDNFVGEYGWFDPISKSETPTDYHTHGTHVTGLAIGKRTGVAPGAKWMGCSAADPNGDMDLEAAVSCMQFMLCPHLTDGSSPNCGRRPHVINNSWGVMGEGSKVLRDAAAAWRAAGIIPVLALGNDGPDCGMTGALTTVETICIGNMDIDNSLRASSTRGPGIDGSIKPDFVAPGNCMYSSGNHGDDNYLFMGGTSMASPISVGVMALLISIKPDLTYDQILKTLTKTANRELTFDGQTCDGISDDVFPNNNFGYGLVDAYAAFVSVLNGDF